MNKMTYLKCANCDEIFIKKSSFLTKKAGYCKICKEYGLLERYNLLDQIFFKGKHLNRSKAKLFHDALKLSKAKDYEEYSEIIFNYASKELKPLSFLIFFEILLTCISFIISNFFILLFALIICIVYSLILWIRYLKNIVNVIELSIMIRKWCL